MAGNYSALAIGGGAATKIIVNSFSAGGMSATGVNANAATNLGKATASGALTANTLATVLTISTPGRIPFLTAYSADITARTIRLVVIADGVTVFDATSDSITAVGRGLIAAGQAIAGSGIQHGEPIRFNSSCVVRVASSLTETDKITVGHVLT